MSVGVAMVLLAVESENGAVLNYRLEKNQITVGSSSRNDVVVRSPAVADRHLVMHRNGDVFTFVTVDRQTVVLNGERRSRGVLYPGDRIRLGPMTLVFRGSETGVAEAIPDAVPPEQDAAPWPPARIGAPQLAFLSDPAGFAATRLELMATLATPHSDCFRRVIALIRDALPGVELAVLAPDGGGGLAAMASVWDGDLPRFPATGLSDLTTPGRYAQIGSGGSATVVYPISALDGEVVGAIAARPAGMLGNEGVGLLGETARLLGLRWREIGRADTVVPGSDVDTRQALGARVPGTSQAVQVLRAGMVAAAVGNDPVLVCGGEGVGRTEMARLLSTIGPGRGRPVVVVDSGGDDRAVRRELFGPTGVPSLAGRVEGAVERARGGVLILRNADRLPLPLQAELAGLISAQQREPAGAGSVRWVVTCGEDPLALVQQGKLEPAFFLVFSRRMLRVPRLAERREDLPLLIAGMLTRVAQEQKKGIRGITLECLNTLLAQPFPGEMAELVGAINRFVTATPDGEMVRCEELSGGGGDTLTRGSQAATSLADVLGSDNLKQVVPRVEQLIIDRVMRQVKGNQSKGARALGISRGALIAKLKEYAVPDYRFLRRRQGRA